MGVGRDRKDKSSKEDVGVGRDREDKSSKEDVGVGRDRKDRNQVKKTWVLDVTEKIEIK